MPKTNIWTELESTGAKDLKKKKQQQQRKYHSSASAWMLVILLSAYHALHKSVESRR